MDLALAADAYEMGTLEFLRAVDLVNDANIDRRVEGGWSARQVVHHVADSETQSYARLRRLLGEPLGSSVQGYDEAAWAECQALGYQELPIENSTALIIAARRSSLDIVRRLGPEHLDRYGEHTETGRYTLRSWIDVYTRHPLEHAAQLIEAINAA